MIRIIILSFFVLELPAQQLMTVGSEKVNVDEFLKIYQKNNNSKISYSQKDINEYVDLFSLFKMKLQEARAQKMDTLPTVVNDYTNYTNQLLVNTIIDKSYTESIYRAQYEHMKYDVKVSHIMVKVSPNAEPKDSLLAFNKIKFIHDKTTKENFATQAKENSEDKNSGMNGGEVGYITAFMTFPDFEEQCFNTPVGQISKVFRTQFGYHFLMVTDKRPSRGRVKVAHIFLKKATDKSDEKKMMEAYQAISSKKLSWSDAVKKYSEDASSKEKGGEIPEFGVSEMVAQFEDNCFNLSKPGDYSKPFSTDFGWHMVKLIEKIPLKSYEESKEFIKSKMERDPRVSDLQGLAYSRLIKKYNLQENNLNFSLISTLVHDSFFAKSNWIIKQDKTYSAQNLFSFGGKNFSIGDFINYSNKNLNSTTSRIKMDVINAMYKTYRDKQIWAISKELTAKENPEYKSLENEYMSGLLIYEIMDKEIWRKAILDTNGVKKIYESVKNDYWYKDRAVVEGLKARKAETIAPYMEKMKSMTARQVLSEIKKTKDSNDVVLYEKTIEKGDFITVDNAMTNPNIPFQMEDEDKTFVIGKISKLIPPSVKPYSEVKGRIQNLYQIQLEKEWTNKLKSKYNVQINQAELNKIIKN